jgi:hypothetical protein
VADAVAVEPVSSLLTGKITGNFDNLGPVGEISGKNCEANQGLADQFPARRNREFLSGNRESFCWLQGIACPFCELTGTSATDNAKALLTNIECNTTFVRMGML